ncbi:hypothetical protein GCM10025870_05970 [Agromyces marinus]|uniref:Nudix hydrolase domain-containing protein n=1 Tax=Agromyces marinus TaxID=1389020 RepID=A0ABM8GYF6_9MICO|nr:hypothetical protein GCM10025870_05970 [Agromyces marinus]
MREVHEESGLVVASADLDARGRLRYLFPYRTAWSQVSNVFVVREFAGAPAPSDELDPEWFPLDAVPLAHMWDDAKHWLPGVLAGGRVERTYVFGEDLATVVEARDHVA